jgi:putative ABC transport system permease protein
MLTEPMAPYWLLLRMAAQNIGRRPLRALLLALAVMMGVGIGFASFVAGWALHTGTATAFARMGADLVVVPRAALVNITASLLTVQPTDETLSNDLAMSVRAIPGVAGVAPQRIVSVLVDGRPASVIAFDPAQDFTVLSWLEDRRPGPISTSDLIVGGRVLGQSGQMLTLCGKPLRIYGRLGKTGVGPFDESYFLTFDALGDIVAFCRGSGTKAGGPPTLPGDGAAVAHVGADVCPTDLQPDRISAFLLQLSPGAKIEEVEFALAQLPNVKIVEGNNVLTSSRQALSALLIGIAMFAVLQLTALLILVSLLFSAIVQERYREVGLLRALGARSNQVMTIILGEAAIITGFAGLAGLVFGAALLLVFARSLGFYFGLLGVPFSWPSVAILALAAVVAVAGSALLGLIGAFVPASRVRRMAPHALIHSGTSTT